MFSPEKVKELLLHEDAGVRDEATYYLEKHFDRTLATADDFWEAIHKYGAPATRRLVYALPGFRQSEASIAHLVEFAEANDANHAPALEVIPHLPIRTLAEHREKLLSTARLHAKLNGLVTEISGLYEATDSHLWDRLCVHAHSMDDEEDEDWNEDWDKDDFQVCNLIAKAIIEHAGDGWQPAVELLRGERQDSWLEILAIQIAGGLKRTEIIPLILPRLNLYDGIQAETITRALIDIADPCVVDAIGGYPDNAIEDFRIAACDVLASYPIPASQQILLSWAKGYPKDKESSRRAVDLCYYLRRQLPDEPEVIEYLLSQVERSHQVFAPMEFGEEGLLLLSKMTGIQFPDAAKWEARMASKKSARVKDMFRSSMNWEESYPDEFSGPKVLPVTKSHTVGRNDPCPCGSGKKYKKCCLGKATASED